MNQTLNGRWLTKLPSHWELRRNGRLFSQTKLAGREDLPILTVSLHNGVKVRDMEDGKQQHTIEDRTKYKRVVEGDIAYNMMRMWQGAIGIAPVDGLVSPAYVTARPHSEINAKFYEYLFRTSLYMGEVEGYSRGIVSDRNRLYWEEFKQIPSPLPPRAEQDAIVAYLDAKLEQIDRFITNKRHLIELLEEERQNNTEKILTTGTNGENANKQTDILWLPKIPNNWRTIPLHYAAESLQTGPFGSQLHSHEYVTEGIPVINPSHMKNGKVVPDYECTVDIPTANRLSIHRVERGDIVFARRGEMGRCVLIGEKEVGWLCGTGGIKMRPRKNLFYDKYLLQILLSCGVADTLSLFSVGTVMDNLNEGILHRLKLPLPPYAEQKEIVKSIESVNNRANKTINKIQKEIDLMNEFRTSLIAEAVTGKIDLQGRT